MTLYGSEQHFVFAANQQGSGTQSSHLKTLLLQVLIITCNSTAWTQATSCTMTATGRIHCALSMDTRTTFPRISFARRGSTSRNVPRRPAVGRQDTNQLALDVRVALSTYCSGSRIDFSGTRCEPPILPQALESAASASTSNGRNTSQRWSTLMALQVFFSPSISVRHDFSRIDR